MELFIDSFAYSVIGFSIVFGVLLCLVLGVKLMNWGDNKLVAGKLKRVENMEVKENTKPQTVDNTTLVLLSSAVAAYFNGRARITKVRVLPDKALKHNAWTMQGRTALQGSHVIKK